MTAQDVLKMAFDFGIDIQVQGNNLRLNAKEAPPNHLVAEIRHYKADLIALLATNAHYPQGVVSVVHPLNVMDKYAHFVKCQHCDHLSLTGSCTKTNKRMMPEALRECGEFELLNSEREPIQAQPYTAIELLTHYEKPLFNHLLACPYCHVEKAQYCASGYAMGSVYDTLLLNRDDAQARRESLALRVDRACISGRSVFEAFNPANVQQSPIAEPR